MTNDYTSRQRRGLILIAACAIAVVAVFCHLVNQLVSANWWVNHTLEVISGTQDSLTSLMECETSYRGFLLTGDRSFLLPYKQGVVHVKADIERIRQLTADNQNQQQLVPVLKRLSQEKIQFADKLIAQDESNHIQRIPLAEGRRIMDQFRASEQDILDQEHILLTTRINAAKQIRSFVNVTVFMLVALILATLAWLAKSTRTFVQAEQKSWREISLARDEAVLANAAKSQFVANVSHELRTPLSGILGMSELLMQSQNAADAREIAQHIYSSGRSLLSVVNDLLDFSKLAAGRLELIQDALSVVQIVNNVRQVVAQEAKNKNLQLSAEIDPSVPDRCEGDPGRLRQVLINLLSNAVKFTEHGEVSLGVTLDKQLDDKSFVRFEIKDSGIGIAEETQSRLFEPFVQADGSTTRRYGGTGLGLSISKQLVYLMGGAIGLESKLGQGSLFWFTVPFARVKERQSEA